MEVTYRPASRIGGDFYIVAPRGPAAALIAIGDVCGRGSPAGVLAARLGPQVQIAAQAAMMPQEFLCMTNRAVQRTLPQDAFVTAICLFLDSRARRVIIANAGHVPALVRRPPGCVDVVGRSSGPPLGLIHDPSYAQESLNLGLQDLLVLMTDGVLESPDGDPAETPLLRALLSSSPKDTARLNRRVLGDLKRRTPRADDLTLLTLELAPDVRCGPRVPPCIEPPP